MGLYFQIYCYLLIGILGLIMGSFLNCCAYRINKKESIVKGRSHCDYCGYELSWYDLIPVLSYLVHHGKCRYCGKKLSIRYPVSEIVTSIVYILLFREYGISLVFLERIILWSFVLCISFSDLEDYLIPDGLIIAGIINRLVFIVLDGNILPDLFNSLIGGLSIAFPLWVLVEVMERIRKKDLMGGGDLKLIFLLGLYVSIYQNLLSLFVSCIIGLVFGMIANKGKTDEAFPFGPSIAMAYFLISLYGNGLIGWYIGLF